jgi:FkbM family methyltransferase
MDKIDFTDFDWGTANEWYKDTILKEFVDRNIYSRFFDVEEGDIVIDVGASNGPFPYSIKHKNPSHVYCFEPSTEELISLEKNLQGLNHTIIPKGISEVDGVNEFEVYGSVNKVETVESIRFQTFINEYNISSIDFLKTDCEGGEYEIFNRENIWWIKENVKKIVGEWHLETPEQKEHFREFRDIYLKLFPNHDLFSVDGFGIKWDLWNEHFIEYYNQVIIYIDNR